MHGPRVFGNYCYYYDDYYDCLNTTVDGNHPFHLPPHVIGRLKSDIDAALAYYSYLCKFSLDHDQALWKVVPKHHYWWHIGRDAETINPRMAWCFANEDFVGRIATVGLSVRHGQAAAFRSKLLIDKYMLGVTLRMYHRRTS